MIVMSAWDWLVSFWSWFTSPDWTGWGVIATVSTGLGTVVLAIAAIYQGRATREQVQLGNRQADIAEGQLQQAEAAAKSAASSAETASLVLREAERARADQGAPRVAIYFSNPQRPVRISDPMPQSLSPAQQKRELFEAIQTALKAGLQLDEFTVPHDNQTEIWVIGNGWLRNEGETAARVRLPVQAWFPNQEKEYQSFVHGPTFDGITEAVLAPGAKASFSWVDRAPVESWVKASTRPGLPQEGDSIWMWFVVFDPREIGVIDTTVAQVQLSGLQPVAQSNERWKLMDENPLRVGAFPTRRNYRAEGAATEDVSQIHEYYGLGTDMTTK